MLLQQGMSWLAAALALPVSAGVAEAWCVAGVPRGDVLAMRSGPSVFNQVTATIAPTACGIKVVGPCYGGWCPVSFRGRSGWSNSAYLVSQTGVATRQSGAARVDQRRASPAPNAAPQRVATAPKRPSPVREIERDREPESERPAPVAVPAPKPAAPPVERTPEPRALTSGSAREVCVQGVARGETLKVRAAPSAGADLRYGFLPDTCGVKITGDCKDGWCPVEYRGYKGWAEEKNLQ